MLQKERAVSSFHINHQTFSSLSHSALPPLICSLNQLPLPPLSLSFFPPVSRCLVIYERRWKTAGARPSQNTREVIQFGVGSKLHGHLRTARLGAEHRGRVDVCEAWISQALRRNTRTQQSHCSGQQSMLTCSAGV